MHFLFRWATAAVLVTKSHVIRERLFYKVADEKKMHSFRLEKYWQFSPFVL